MAVVFISHSSKDDRYASALEQWLSVNGFTEIFVDHESIVGGEKWREALRQASHSCRVVLCLVSINWLGSSECFGEFLAGWYLGRRIIPLFLLPKDQVFAGEARARLDRLCGEDQGIDLLPCLDPNGVLDIARNEGVATKLVIGLRSAGANTKIGLDPAAFAVDKKLREMPFPGLASFGDDDADAALFYGRSREIANVLEDLRSMRALNDRRPLVIQGSSGAGKSSLLKAGIIPRLRRETPAWLPLRAFRPGADPLFNFADAICRTLADFDEHEAPGVIRDRLREAWDRAPREKGTLSAEGLSQIQALLEAEGDRLRRAADRPDASLLITVDQAEELAHIDNASSDALADFLRTPFASPLGKWQLAFTIRTDSLPELQKHRCFQNLEARGYDLRAVPVFRFDTVVEEPAKRYGVKVEAGLVDALMADAPKDDALPLLAFALQRLWRQYGASGELTETHYKNLGGLSGLIEDAAERALRSLDQDAALGPREPSAALLALARSTFVPALVQINDQGSAIRRSPSWRSFTSEGQELLDRFDRWRLVIRKGKEDQHGGSVEVAHEALFRAWSRLADWLRGERIRLEALHSLQADTAAWKRKGTDPGYLNHRGERLAEAQALTTAPAFDKQVGDDERAYLAACRAAAQQRRRQALRNRAVVAALLLLLAAGGVGIWQQDWLKEQYQWRLVMGPSVLSAEQGRELAASPGASFSECATGCPTLVIIPAGKAPIGATSDEASDDERPRHEVTIAKAFAIGSTDVTFAQWRRCVAAGACPMATAAEGWGADDLPVTNVSWNNAESYVAWLSSVTGKPYRLPSEAEWEYAARAGSTTSYLAGEDRRNIADYAWYADNSENRTHPVRHRKANAFGVFDMQGNVWQWCQDNWHPNYLGAPSDGAAWPGGDGSERILRGGAWDSEAYYLRLEYRDHHEPGSGAENIGFRIARTLD